MKIFVAYYLFWLSINKVIQSSFMPPQVLRFAMANTEVIYGGQILGTNLDVYFTTNTRTLVFFLSNAYLDNAILYMI